MDMWKKLLITFIALVGTFSVGYAYYNKMLNATGGYSSGGVATGRINIAPGGISGSHIGLQAGDHVMIGGTNPVSDNPLSFQLLLYDKNYTDYNNTDTSFVVRSPLSNWLTVSDELVTEHFTLTRNVYSKYLGLLDYFIFKDFIQTDVYLHLNAFNQYIKDNSESSIIAPRSLSELRNWAKFSSTDAEPFVRIASLESNMILKVAKDLPAFINYLDPTLFNDTYSSPITTQMLEFYDSGYHMYSTVRSDLNYECGNVMQADGTSADIAFTSGSALRPYLFLDLSNVVFGLSMPDGGGARVKVDDTFVLDPASAYYTQGGPSLKLRILKSDMEILFQSITDAKGKPLSKVITDKKLYLNASGTTGTNHTVSVLIFDSKNHFIGYQPLKNTQSGMYAYEFDTKGLPEGKYKIALVNEIYDADSTDPTYSSLISDTKPLEIVKPHKLTYTKTPQKGATEGKEYEFSKNVDEGQAVGKITVNPYGVMPLTYKIISNGGDTYENFEIAGLDKNNASGASELNVIIKKDAPDVVREGKEPNVVKAGLKAGTYGFCITATDANEDPDPLTADQKVCTTFKIEKTDPEIDFDDPEQTEKSIEEAQAGWSEPATAKPSIAAKITYSVSGGDISLIKIDKDTGQITYQGNEAFGKVTIKATVDDKPESGYDNYNKAETEKEIVIYREVEGTVIPDSKSSSTTIPTFTASDTNIKKGGIIGTIKGTKGTPDVIGGSVTTYTYGLKEDEGDANYFSVDEGSGVIRSKANLGVGSYHITVTVSDAWSTKEIPVTINVGVAAAEELKFYKDSESETVITKKSVSLTDKGATVYATVKESSNTNPVTYKIKDGSTNVITINPDSGAVTIKGVGTVTIVAEKKGASGQADARAELTFTVTAGEQDFIYTDSAGNELPKTNDKYKAYEEVYKKNKTFQLYTAGNPVGSTVTYQLKPGSPTDVISVDPDGTIHILNASKNDQINKVIVQATSHDPSGDYDDKTIELPINIEKGTRKIAFADNPVTVVNGSGSVTPNILVDGVLDTSGTAVIEIDPNEDSGVAWTNDGETIQYSWEKETSKDVKLHVTKPADRNYKAAEGDGILHILGADENVLTLSTPGKIIYGDHFTIRSTQDDSGSTNVQYKFETDNGVYISAPDVNGNKAGFDALAYSGSTLINIKVTRTADGELPLTKTVSIKVLPKPITIQIDDKEKKRLEENPELTYKDFTSQLVSWDGVKDDIDTSHIKLTTTAKKTSPVGTYPITAGSTQKQLNDNYPNYTFTIKEGKLNIKDNGNKDFWDDDDDGCPDFNITITGDDGNTILINGDKNDDGIPDYNIDINGDGKPELNIDTDNDGKPDLNLVILKSWKPSRCVTVNGVDYESGISAKAEINVDLDGDGIPDINIDNKGDFKPHINISKDGKKPQVNIVAIHEWKPGKDYKKTFAYDSIGDEIKPELNIDTDGDGYPDLNLDLDDDGEADINIDLNGDGIPDIDIDSTGDGKPDTNVDNDGDGEPDENIVEIKEWKPEHNVDGDIPYDTMSFDDPKNPDDEDNPDGSNNDPDDTDVKGAYYPGKYIGGAQSVGGALTGDTTNIMMYMGVGCMAIGTMTYLIFKRKTEE